MGFQLEHAAMARHAGRRRLLDGPQVSESGHGFGFVTSNRGGIRGFGHGGGAPGMNGDLQIFPDSGQVVVVLSNLDPPSASKVSGWLTSRMLKD